MKAEPRAKPLIKYAGGKRWAIPTAGAAIERHLLAHPDARYIDPFVGGGAIPYWLGMGQRMILGDVLQPIAELHEVIRDKPGELAFNLSAIAILGVDEEAYNRVKGDHNRGRGPATPVARAARFLYLNRLGFNGLVRYNAAGAFNVPYGSDKRRESVIENGSRDAIESLFPNKGKMVLAGQALHGAEIWNAHFHLLAIMAKEHDVLLLDPPYHHTFKSYAAQGFSYDDHRQLAADALEAARERGATVLLFNNDTPFVRDLYKDFTIINTQERRSINSKGTKRAPVPCVVATNRPDLFSEMEKAAA